MRLLVKCSRPKVSEGHKRGGGDTPACSLDKVGLVELTI